MANKSQNLKDGFQLLPSSISGLLDKTIPAAPTVATPTDTDSAIKAQGVLSKYLLDVFAELEGFSIAAAMMHIGQLNTVNQVVALSALQVRDGYAQLEIILPVDGAFPSLESPFICEVNVDVRDLSLIESVSMHREAPDATTLDTGMLSADSAVENELLPADLVTQGHYYEQQILYDPGVYTYSFTAVVDGQTITAGPVEVTGI
jgi:hypothetical protein